MQLLCSVFKPHNFCTYLSTHFSYNSSKYRVRHALCNLQNINILARHSIKSWPQFFFLRNTMCFIFSQFDWFQAQESPYWYRLVGVRHQQLNRTASVTEADNSGRHSSTKFEKSWSPLSTNSQRRVDQRRLGIADGTSATSQAVSETCWRINTKDALWRRRKRLATSYDEKLTRWLAISVGD